MASSKATISSEQGLSSFLEESIVNECFRFTCYDHGRKPEATDMLRREKDENLRSELVSVLYDQNVLGFKGKVLSKDHNQCHDLTCLFNFLLEIAVKCFLSRSILISNQRDFHYY